MISSLEIYRVDAMRTVRAEKDGATGLQSTLVPSGLNTSRPVLRIQSKLLKTRVNETGPGPFAFPARLGSSAALFWGNCHAQNRRCVCPYRRGEWRGRP